MNNEKGALFQLWCKEYIIHTIISGVVFWAVCYRFEMLCKRFQKHQMIHRTSFLKVFVDWYKIIDRYFKINHFWDAVDANTFLWISLALTWIILVCFFYTNFMSSNLYELHTWFSLTLLCFYQCLHLSDNIKINFLRKLGCQQVNHKIYN